MKQLILHAGIPKTGSSVLQVFWAQNHEGLLARSLDYFKIGDFKLGESGKISSGNGARLARTFLHPANPIHLKDREGALAALEEEIGKSSCETGLLSSEIFIDATDESLAEFRTWLKKKGITLKVFYFIRNQVQFLASSYIQQVKRHGCTEMPDEYVQRAYKNIPYLKYSSVLDRFASIVGAENVICRSYDAALASKGGVFETFFGAFGMPSDGLEPVSEDINTSLQPSEIVIMLLLNKMKPRMMFSDFLVENAVRRGAMSAGVQHHILSEKTVRLIEQHFAEDNRNIARSYFKRDALFEHVQGGQGVNSISGAALSFSDVIDCFGGLLIRFDERLVQIESRLAKLAAGK